MHDRARFERTHRERRAGLVANAVRAIATEAATAVGTSSGVVELQHALVAELAKADLPGLGISPDDVLARANVPPLPVTQGIKAAVKTTASLTAPVKAPAVATALAAGTTHGSGKPTGEAFAAPLARHEVAL